jgi:hypothetical protein
MRSLELGTKTNFNLKIRLKTTRLLKLRRFPTDTILPKHWFYFEIHPPIHLQSFVMLENDGTLIKVMLKNLALNQELPVWRQDPLGRKKLCHKVALRFEGFKFKYF